MQATPWWVNVHPSCRPGSSGGGSFRQTQARGPEPGEPSPSRDSITRVTSEPPWLSPFLFRGLSVFGSLQLSSSEACLPPGGVTLHSLGFSVPPASLTAYFLQTGCIPLACRTCV